MITRAVAEAISPKGTWMHTFWIEEPNGFLPNLLSTWNGPPRLHASKASVYVCVTIHAIHIK